MTTRQTAERISQTNRKNLIEDVECAIAAAERGLRDAETAASEGHAHAAADRALFGSALSTLRSLLASERRER